MGGGRVADLHHEPWSPAGGPAMSEGCTAYEVREALKRIRRYMKSIVAAERGEDEEVT